MAKVPGSDTTIELMVNCKTYPSISQKYTETVCTGGIQKNGKFVRLYPVPFRFLDSEEQYDRWDVIRVPVYKDPRDPRPESWHLAGPIKVLGKVTTEKKRWEWMKKAVHPSKASMEEKGVTNGCVRIEPMEFYAKRDNKKLTAKQRGVLQQGDFLAPDKKKAAIADLVPWEFRLKFKEFGSSEEEDKKVLAWSIYAGYRRQLKMLKDEKAAVEAVKLKVEQSIFDPERTVFGIFGTHKVFKLWMISALYHLPTKIIKVDKNKGGELF